jgi:hypothetical protein
MCGYTSIVFDNALNRYYNAVTLCHLEWITEEDVVFYGFLLAGKIHVA